MQVFDVESSQKFGAHFVQVVSEEQVSQRTIAGSTLQFRHMPSLRKNPALQMLQRRGPDVEQSAHPAYRQVGSMQVFDVVSSQRFGAHFVQLASEEQVSQKT